MSDRDSTFDALLRDVARTPVVTVVKRPGDCFAGGRYRVERRLGSGGQKDVFLVRDTALERFCALSLLQPDQVDAAQLKRFRLEAQALARFGAHSHIVTIYDLGEEDGVPYVLCEYLEGGDLRAAMESGPMAAERALEIARDVCRGLAFAHERGVVHRDVSPANIWLLGDGTAKLGDFGLALVSDRSRLTSPDAVLGTAAYMAPEQARGEPVDPRSDLYALGCVLHEMLAGEPPFTGSKPIEVVSQHIHAAPPPVDRANPAVSPAVAAVVARLLAKRPADRYPDARSLLTELQHLLAPVPPGPHPTPADEAGRLAALHELGVLDTPPEVAYDEIVELAAQICETPLAYICFIDETRQWMKANVGFAPELTSAPREIGVCQTTICQGDVLVAPDLTADDRFRHLPPVTDLGMRFYCGAPLVTPAGHAVGTICVMDTKPRELSFQQIEAVRRLARQVVTRFELVKARAELERARAGAAVATEPRYHDSLTVGVIDVGNFAELAIATAPAELLEQLDAYVSAVDGVVRDRGLEKLGTFGASYLFAGGLDGGSRRHPVDACLTALALRRAIGATGWAPRIALHAGPAMSGAVGSWKPDFGIWGQTANLAARIAAELEPGRIAISESVFERVKALFDAEPAGRVDVEGRGQLAVYSLERIKPELSIDGDGREPNEAFAALAG